LANRSVDKKIFLPVSPAEQTVFAFVQTGLGVPHSLRRRGAVLISAWSPD
jgi:hypothetical protein